MIGKIVIGKDFKGCIYYCLEDKKLAYSHEVAFRNRAEVLYGNYCYGNKEELIVQFNEVRRLNPRIEKPVMHLTLSLAPDEQLPKEKLIETVYDLAKEIGFQQHQYLAVSHLDTGHQHVHIVVNRIGYDGKTLKDNHNYRKMAACCRKLELKYGLQQVLSPRKYLSKEQRLIPRHDIRKQSLRKHIEWSLITCKSFEDFQQQMKGYGYRVLNGKGIVLMDDKGVKIKGSEVGYPLRKVEQILRKKVDIQQVPGAGNEKQENAQGRLLHNLNISEDKGQPNQPHEQKEKGLEKTIGLFLKPEPCQEEVPQPLLTEQKIMKRNHKTLHL